MEIASQLAADEQEHQNVSQEDDDTRWEEEGRRDRSEVKCWTYTHYPKDGETAPYIPDADCLYRIEGKEICPSTGRQHTQGYCHLLKACRWTAFKSKYPHISKFFKSKGNGFENFTYCSKDGDFIEFGPRPKEPKKSKPSKDLAFAKALEADTVQEGLGIIRKESPRDFCLYGNTIENSLKRAKQKPFEPKYQPEDFNIPRLDLTKTNLITGPSNVGKTQFALSHFKNPLVVSHMDALRKLGPDNDGIVFDDMAFKHYPVESVIHLLDRDLERQLNVRYTYVTVPANTAKVFTHNDDNPFYNLDTISNEQREAIERRFIRTKVYRKLYAEK